jgi:beta-1,4-mannosyl-glycoprotein beta-1,4-N-acetylglucosaminyltransferase
MKLFDCFTFFNELDLLEFRLKLLGDHVDYFVICESNLTHSGKSKEYILNNNISRFNKWKNKIIYLPIEQSIEGLSFDEVNTYTPTNGSWILENQQRSGLSYVNNMIDDNDLVLVGDLDEIPNPEIIKKIIDTEIPINNPIVLRQLFHYYFLNCQNEGAERWWNGTILSNGICFKEYGPQELRNNRNNLTILPLAGWHFSYLGGIEKIKAKIQSFAHTEFNRPDILSDENIIEALEKGTDVLKRPGVYYKFYPLDYYPEYLRDLMKQYPLFIKDI